MDLETLALAVDERVRMPAADRNLGRLYAVRCDPAHDERPESGGERLSARIAIELLGAGEARTLPQKVRPPGGLRAIALASGVWVAPLDPEGEGRRPSRHPERRRAHLTVLVAPEGDRDGVDVSVLRSGDGSPTILRGGVGLIHGRMLRCWSRRPDAPPASRHPPAPVSG